MPLYGQHYYERLNGGHRMAGAAKYYSRCLCLSLFTDMIVDVIGHIVGPLASVLSIKAD